MKFRFFPLLAAIALSTTTTLPATASSEYRNTFVPNIIAPDFQYRPYGAHPVVTQGYIYAPPSNIRYSPNGEVKATIRTPVCVPIHGWIGEWNLISYPHLGWVHDSQIYFGYCP